MATVFGATEVGVDFAFDAVGKSSLINDGLQATRMGGTTVMVGVAAIDDQLLIESPTLFAFAEKKLLGCLLGGVNSLRDIPRLIDLWQAGLLDLDGLVTSRRPLAEINDAFDDLRAGRGIRSVITI